MSESQTGDPRERFIEDHPETLKWSKDPVSREERRRANEIFRWISKH